MTPDPFTTLIEETNPEVLAEGHRWVQQHFYGETMYTDYFLKFDNEDEARMQLYEEEVDDTRTPKYAAIDVIGTIYEPTGNMIDTDEGEMPEMAPIEGWHVNVRHNAEAPELDQWRVFPSTPQRLWA